MDACVYLAMLAEHPNIADSGTSVGLIQCARCMCRYDAERHAIVVDLEGYNFLLDPATVRRNDTSAASINEWTGERLSRSAGISDDIRPDTIAPLGNYAVQILWQDGFNQVSTDFGWTGVRA